MENGRSTEFLNALRNFESGESPARVEGNGDGLSLVGGRAVDDVQRRVVEGGNGNDVLNQSNFTDPVDIDGGRGNDQITGTSVASVSDVLRGGEGNDTFFGLAGDDFIIPGPGDDLRVVGGAGTDTFFPETNGGNDIFPEFSLQDRLDGTLLAGVTAINVSRLDNGRTLLEFEGANTTVQISGGVSPEQFIANADQLLVNFPDGVRVQAADADVANAAPDVVIDPGNNGGNAGAGGTGTGVSAADFGINAPAAPAAMQQTVSNNQGGLTVAGTNGVDGVAFGNTGADIISGFGGDDALVGFNGNDFLDGGDGNDRVFGSQDDDIVLGGAGDDILRGDNEAAGNGNDIIVGGTGNDLLKGDGNNLVGQDIFVFSPGDGDDVIEDFQPGVDRLDVSAFGNADLNIAQQGGDAVVRIGDVSVTLRGINANDLSAGDFNGNGIAAGNNGAVQQVPVVEEVQIEEEPVVERNGDGLSLVGGRAVDDVQRRVVEGGNGNDVLNQSNFTDPVDIDGGRGNDQITGTSVAGVSDVLRGGEGNDTFFGLAGDDFIIPGPGDDLRVVGGAGTDTFFPETNGGNDIFPEFSLQDRLDGTLLAGVTAINVSRLDNGRTFLEFEGANTTVQISGGVSPEQFIANADQLLVNFPDGVRVQAAGADVANAGNNVVENNVVENAAPDVVIDPGNNGDGLSLVGGRAVDDVQRRVVEGGNGNDVLNQSNFTDPVDIDGGRGNDQITGTSVAGVSDVLRGGEGNDTFFGLAGDDFIIPGPGDDLRVVGGAGTDTFFPETNGGNDIFPEFSLQDRLDGTLLAGVTAINVSRLDNGRTFLEFEGANTTVQISGGVSPEQFIANADQLLVNFPDGVRVQAAGADVANAANNVVENNVVENAAPDVVIDPGNNGGNAGASGASTGVSAADFGINAPAAPAAVQQTVANNQGGLTVTGTNGVDGVAFGNTGADIISGFGGDDALVGFNGNDFLDGGDGNDRVFGSQDDDIVLGGAGDDILRGDNEAAGNGNDIIVGGTGNDLLKGDGNNLVGRDIFVFSSGDGNDVIEDFQPGVDRLDVSRVDDGIVVTTDQQGSSTIVSVGDVTITLQNVDANDISDDDFIGATADEDTDAVTPTFLTDDSLIG